GALDLRGKSEADRVRYMVDFLDSREEYVAASAVSELQRASYADLRRVAETLKPEPLLAAIKNEKTTAKRLGSYARLLAHCGKKEHAAEIRKRLDKLQARDLSSDLMLAYIHLDPEAGWKYLEQHFDSNNKPPFLARFYAMKTFEVLADEKT